MPSSKTSFTVGLFTVIGLAIAITAIIWLGMSNYFEKGQNYVAFFDESIQGLDKDSPVKYRGVSIGRVKSVGVAPDATLIEVVMTIDKDMRLESDMVAQLKSVGITGIMFIEIDRKKEGEPDYHPPISFYTEYPIVVTKPSGLKMFMDGMDDIRSLINELDAGGISDKLKVTVDKVNHILENTDKAVSGLNRVVSNNEKDLNEAIDNLKRSMRNADKFLKQGADLMKSSDTRLSDLQRHLIVTLQNLEKASEGLSNFADNISDQPSQLIFGEPVPSKKADRIGD
ncbi:MAG: MCE family protein [Desulfobacterales bacterium]|nr:MCE family protein [Desulfobacterales bacterium]